MRSEESRRIYKNLNEIMGKQRSNFTQVDVPCDPLDPSSGVTTLTSKLEIKQQILQRNRRHSLQSLSTPFLSRNELASSIDPLSHKDKLHQLLCGSFLDSSTDDLYLTEDEKRWIEELHRTVKNDISLTITLEDYKKLFRAKKKKKASSPSGGHMGHYKTLLECIRTDNPVIPSLIIDIAYIVLITASPLFRWNTACQITTNNGIKSLASNHEIRGIRTHRQNFL
jgi:hypothetical protein